MKNHTIIVAGGRGVGRAAVQNAISCSLEELRAAAQRVSEIFEEHKQKEIEMAEALKELGEAMTCNTEVLEAIEEHNFNIQLFRWRSEHYKSKCKKTQYIPSVTYNARSRLK